MIYSDIIPVSVQNAPTLINVCGGNPGGGTNLSAPTAAQYITVPSSETRWKNSSSVGPKPTQDSGDIKITDLSVGTIKKRRLLVQVPQVSRAVNHWCRSTSCATDKVESQEGSALWYLQGDLDYFVQVRQLQVYLSKAPDFNNRIERLKTQAFEDLMHSFDVTTEILELPKTLATALRYLTAAVRPLRTYKKAREEYDRLRKSKFADQKVLQKITADAASAWLQLRYAVMPVLLSIDDALKLEESRQFAFEHARSRSIITVDETSKGSSPHNHIYDRLSGTITVRAYAKGVWSSGQSKHKDRLSANLFYSAWQLTPFSWVVDWFLNVSSLIASVTSTPFSTAVQTKACYSVRTELTREFFLYHRTDQSQTFTRTFRCEGKDQTKTKTLGSDQFKDFLLGSDVENSYLRKPYNESDTKFVFDPSLDWKRIVDGISLAITPLNKSLRSLQYG